MSTEHNVILRICRLLDWLSLTFILGSPSRVQDQLAHGRRARRSDSNRRKSRPHSEKPSLKTDRRQKERQRPKKKLSKQVKKVDSRHRKALKGDLHGLKCGRRARCGESIRTAGAF